MGLTPKGGRKAPVAPSRSGRVSEGDRNTKAFRVRCTPELEARALAMAKWHKITRAAVLEYGVCTLEMMKVAGVKLSKKGGLDE